MCNYLTYRSIIAEYFRVLQPLRHILPIAFLSATKVADMRDYSRTVIVAY